MQWSSFLFFFFWGLATHNATRDFFFFPRSAHRLQWKVLSFSLLRAQSRLMYATYAKLRECLRLITLTIKWTISALNSRCFQGAQQSPFFSLSIKFFLLFISASPFTFCSLELHFSGHFSFLECFSVRRHLCMCRPKTVMQGNVFGASSSTTKIVTAYTLITRIEGWWTPVRRTCQLEPPNLTSFVTEECICAPCTHRC